MEIIIYDTKMLQEILGCGRRQAYDLMKSPTFPSIRIGSKYIVEKNAFLQWLKANETKTVLL